MLQHVARIEQERAVRFELGTPLRTEPALCNQSVVNELLRAAEAVGVEPALLPSGGGHDAAVFAQAGVPAGMIFIRNRNGSHNPQEAMEISDFGIATAVLHQFLMNPATPSGNIDALHQTMKDPDTMFSSITDIIRQKGNAARAYRAAATAAQEAALRDKERASGYFLLATATQEVADLHYGEPIHGAVFDQELARLEGYATMLDAAFEKSEPNERLAVVNQVAAALAAARASA